MLVIMTVHIIGARINRNKAKKWIRANAPVLASEFAMVGYEGKSTMEDDTVQLQPDSLIKEKSLYEFATYATGRQNVAFMDVKLTMSKRFNPFVNFVELIFGFFSSMFSMPEDIVEAVIYPFDGKESLTVPALASESANKDGKSTYNDFVWALVHKDHMQKIREDRYDASLTITKDNSKLPIWLTVMSESAEVTDALLTPELIEAAKAAGDDFQYLLVTDQPSDKPKTLKEATARKRVYLKYRLPSSNNFDNLVAIFSHFTRLPDLLVQKAHFRPEVTRKITKVREQMDAQLKKALSEEIAEERLLDKEKAKKAKRDAELGALDAKAQKKYLEKEREKELRKSQKKQTMRG
jgi:hypothetical protein